MVLSQATTSLRATSPPQPSNGSIVRAEPPTDTTTNRKAGGWLGIPILSLSSTMFDGAPFLRRSWPLVFQLRSKGGDSRIRGSWCQMSEVANESIASPNVSVRSRSSSPCDRTVSGNIQFQDQRRHKLRYQPERNPTDPTMQPRSCRLPFALKRPPPLLPAKRSLIEARCFLIGMRL